MIYEPRVVVNLYNVIGGALFRAALLALGDFVAQENKPWAYYLGAALGYSAAATGIPGAAVTLYAVGSSVDAVLFHSPDGSLVRVFLNGILVASIDTYAASPSWQSTAIGGLALGLTNQLTFVSEVNPNGDKTSTIEWFGLGSLTVNGDGSYIQGAITMAYHTVVFRMQDSETDVVSGALPIYIPKGTLTLAEIQTWVNAVAPEVDAITGSKLSSVEVTIRLDLPGGLKASPVTNILNERGGLITFDTAGPRKDSVRIPAMHPDFMPGDTFDITETEIAAFITRLTTATTAASIRPVTVQEYNWVTARKGSKSLRR